MHCSDLREDTGLGTTSLVCFESQVFRVLLFRRHWLHLLLAPRNCWFGCRLDSSGHHRTACVKSGSSGVLRVLWRVQLRVFVAKQEGGRVSLCVPVPDLDLAAIDLVKTRRLEVGWRSWSPDSHCSTQIILRQTPPSFLESSARPGSCATTDGAALLVARRKESPFLELAGRLGRAKLVCSGPRGQRQVVWLVT